MSSGAPQHVRGRQRGSQRLLAGIVLAAVVVGALAYHLLSDYEVLLRREAAARSVGYEALAPDL